MKTIALFFISIALLFSGCETLQEKGISPELISTAIGATAKAARPISDEEEYYVGRAVAARLLSMYPLYQDRRLTEYINLIGKAVALQSEKPDTYNGYHFAILDSREINAFACPGGMIFITRGMLNAVENEDELAAVLAHEVAHVNHRDGISSIKRARWTEALTIIGSSAAKEYGSKELANLVSIFEGSIDDIVKTVVVSGYGQSQELDADKAALGYLAKTGYNPGALKDFIVRLISKGKGSEGGVLKTHPATSDRLKEVEDNMPSVKIDPSGIHLRSKRFISSIR